MVTRLWPTAKYTSAMRMAIWLLPLKADFDPKNDDPIFETNMLVPIYSTPVVANGTLYVGTQTHLYAIEEKAGK